MSKDPNSSPGKLWSGIQPQPEDNVLPLHSERVYKAFDTRDRNNDRLHIRCATEPSRYPSSSYLLDIIFDHDFEGAFTLIYSFMVVEVTGENLGQVVHAIYYGNCECIREFHPNKHDRPARGEPLINAVRIVAAAPPISRASAKPSLTTDA